MPAQEIRPAARRACARARVMPGSYADSRVPAVALHWPEGTGPEVAPDRAEALPSEHAAQAVVVRPRWTLARRARQLLMRELTRPGRFDESVVRWRAGAIQADPAELEFERRVPGLHSNDFDTMGRGERGAGQLPGDVAGTTTLEASAH